MKVELLAGILCSEANPPQSIPHWEGKTVSDLFKRVSGTIPNGETTEQTSLPGPRFTCWMHFHGGVWGRGMERNLEQGLSKYEISGGYCLGVEQKV